MRACSAASAGRAAIVAGLKPESALFEIRNIAEEIAARGGKHSADVLLLTSEKASAEAAVAFDIKPGARLFHSLLLHRENGQPVQLEDRLVSPAFAPAYLKQNFTAATPHQYLMGAAAARCGRACGGGDPARPKDSEASRSRAA